MWLKGGTLQVAALSLSYCIYLSLRLLASIPGLITLTIFFSFAGKAKGCVLRYVPT